MLAAAFVLSFLSSASAQLVIGMSMVPASGAAVSADIPLPTGPVPPPDPAAKSPSPAANYEDPQYTPPPSLQPRATSRDGI